MLSKYFSLPIYDLSNVIKLFQSKFGNVVIVLKYIQKSYISLKLTEMPLKSILYLYPINT